MIEALDVLPSSCDVPSVEHSYRSKAAGQLGGTPPVCENAANIVLEDGDVNVTRGSRGPSICFSRRIKNQLYQLWKHALIIKLMGATHTYNYFLFKLQQNGIC